MKICFISILVSLFSLGITKCQAQYKWNWKDPLDLNYFDYGDNKLLLYNALGVGAAYLFDQSGSDSSHNQISVRQYIFYEYDRDPLSNIYLTKFRYSWPLKKFLSIGADLGFALAEEDNMIIPGIVSALSFRWTIINSRNIGLVFDNGVGPNLMFEPFPSGGTTFSFNTFYGFELNLSLAPRKQLTIGAHNLHISNADIKGKERNPAYDGIGISVGLRWTLSRFD